MCEIGHMPLPLHNRPFFWTRPQRNAVKEKSKKYQRNEPGRADQGPRADRRGRSPASSSRSGEPISSSSLADPRSPIRDPGMTYTEPGMTYTTRIAEPISSLDELEPRIADQGARLSVFRFSIDAAIPRETSRASIGFPVFDRRASAAHAADTRKHGPRIADQGSRPWPEITYQGERSTSPGPRPRAQAAPLEGGRTRENREIARA